LEEGLHVAAKKLSHNAHATGDGAGTHEEHNVRMVDLAEDLHFFPEGIEGLRVEVLLMKHLNCYILGTGAALINSAE
jgi:hypothetical protein